MILIEVQARVCWLRPKNIAPAFTCLCSGHSFSHVQCISSSFSPAFIDSIWWIWMYLNLFKNLFKNLFQNLLCLFEASTVRTELRNCSSTEWLHTSRTIRSSFKTEDPGSVVKRNTFWMSISHMKHIEQWNNSKHMKHYETMWWHVMTCDIFVTFCDILWHICDICVSLMCYSSLLSLRL